LNCAVQPEVGGGDAGIVQHLLDDLHHRHVLEHAAVDGLAEEPIPRHQHGVIGEHPLAGLRASAHLPGGGEFLEYAVEVARRVIVAPQDHAARLVQHPVGRDVLLGGDDLHPV
jgi:hypothetical protein